MLCNVMASLHCKLLPSSHLLPENSSPNLKTNKSNPFPPNFKKLQAASARNLCSNDGVISTQRAPQALLVAASENARHFSSEAQKNLNNECQSVFDPFTVSYTQSYDCKQIHGQFAKLGLTKSNSLIGNKLVILYLKKGSLEHARQVFDEIAVRTPQAYASFIGFHYRCEQWEELFGVLRLMVDDGLSPDRFLVPTILKGCSVAKLFRIGKMIHGYVVRRDMGMDVFVGNALIDFYSNCGNLRSSQNVFDAMKEKDVVTWTALVTAYMDEGLVHEAEDVFRLMEFGGTKGDVISWNALVSGFARNGEIDMAIEYLEGMQEKGLKLKVSSWNGVISGCVQNGNYEDGFNVFNRMLRFPEEPNVVSIVSILPACAGLKNLNLGREIHGYAIKSELCRNIQVKGSIMDMYSKCGRCDHAQKVFDDEENKNTAMWNEMIAAYVNEQKFETALALFRSMQNDGLKPDVITYNTLLAEHARKGKKREAYALLSEMSQAGLKPNIVSFNVLISGFQQCGLSYEALKLFQIMQSHSNYCLSNEVANASLRPNPVTVTGALAACADLSSLHQGKEIHGFVLKNGLESNVFISSAMVDMYAKCYAISSAAKLFWNIEDRNTVAWNSLITGYISNKLPEEALKLFHAMMCEGIEPSSITFQILLPICGDRMSPSTGRQIHGYIIKSQLSKLSNSLASPLLDMCGKCACLT